MRRFVLSTFALLVLVLAAVAFARGSGEPTARAQAKRGLTPLQQRLMSGLRVARARAADCAGAGAAGAQDAPGAGRRRQHGRDRLPGEPRQQRPGQPELPEPHRPRPAGPRPGAERDVDRAGPEQPAAHRRVAERLPPRRRQLLLVRTPATAAARGRTPRRRWASRAGTPSAASRASTGRPAATRRWRGTRKGNAYLSCQMFNRGDGRLATTRTSRARSTSSARPAAAARRGTSRRGRSPSSTTSAGAGDVAARQAVHDGRRPPRAARSRTASTSPGRCSPPTARATSTRPTRATTASTSARRSSSAPTARCAPTTSASPTPQGRCNTNQFSQPFTGPDGALYVVWDNFNLTGVRPGEGDDEGGGDAARRNAAPQGVDNRARCCSPSRPTAATPSRRRSRSPTTTTCPTARPTRATGPGRACVPGEGRDGQLDLPGRRTTRRAPSTRATRSEIDVTFGSYINRHSNEGNGCVPQGFNPDTFQPLYDGVKTAGRVQQRHPDQPLDQRRQGVHRRHDRRARAAGGTRGDDRVPTSSGSGPRSTRAAGWPCRTTTAPTATTRRPGSRTSACRARATAATSPPRASRRPRWPPATQFERPVLRRLQRAERRTTPRIRSGWTRAIPNLFVCRDSAGNVTLPPSVCTAGAPNAAVANDQNVYTDSISIPLP